VEHPLVRDCVVVGPEDPQWGQIIVAVVVPATTDDGPANPDPDELREHVRAHLRGSRTPDRVVFRDELPTNATGKVLRRELVQELTASN
jgi:acyl-CoA synthetase (AMP-forming)/AMP-acid ligase II